MSVPNYLKLIAEKRDQGLSLGEATRAVRKEYALKLLNQDHGPTPEDTKVILNLILELL